MESLRNPNETPGVMNIFSTTEFQDYTFFILFDKYVVMLCKTYDYNQLKTYYPVGTDHGIIQACVSGDLSHITVSTQYFLASQFRKSVYDKFFHLEFNNYEQSIYFIEYFREHNKNGTLPTREEWENFLIEFRLLGL